MDFTSRYTPVPLRPVYPCPLVSTLCPCQLSSNPNQIQKENQKPNQTKTTKEFCHGSCSVAHWATQFTLSSLHLYLQVFTTMSHWFGSSSLVSATPSIMGSSWISCCCLVSWRSCCFWSVGSSHSDVPTLHRFDGCWRVNSVLNLWTIEDNFWKELPRGKSADAVELQIWGQSVVLWDTGYLGPVCVQEASNVGVAGGCQMPSQEQNWEDFSWWGFSSSEFLLAHI